MKYYYKVPTNSAIDAFWANVRFEILGAYEGYYYFQTEHKVNEAMECELPQEFKTQLKEQEKAKVEQEKAKFNEAKQNKLKLSQENLAKKFSEIFALEKTQSKDEFLNDFKDKLWEIFSNKWALDEKIKSAKNIDELNKIEVK